MAKHVDSNPGPDKSITSDHCRLHPEEARRQWVASVMSGHFASAAYVEPDLPPLVRIDRNSHLAGSNMISGEIN